MDAHVSSLDDQCKIGKIKKRSSSSLELTNCKSNVKPIKNVYNKSVRCDDSSDKIDYENILLSLFRPSIVTVNKINSKTRCLPAKKSQIQNLPIVKQDRIQSIKKPIQKSVKYNYQVMSRHNLIKERLASSPRKPRTVIDRPKPRYENRERLYRYALLQNLGSRAAKLGFKTKCNWPQQLKIEFTNLVKKQLT